MKILIAFFVVFLSQFPTKLEAKCLANGDANDPAIIAKCGQPYQALNPEADMMELVRTEVEVSYLHEFNCSKKNFTPCEKYSFYLKETSKHAADAFCKREGNCLSNYRKAVIDLKQYYAARNFLAVYANPDQYKDAFFNPREVADEARVYLTFSGDKSTSKKIAGEEFAARICRKEKHEELGSDASACRRYIDAYIKGLERTYTASAN